MMKRTILAVAIPALLTVSAVNAAEIYNKDGNKLDLYGKMVAQRAWTLGSNSNNADDSYVRVGIKGETQINSQLKGYGQWEYQMEASKEERAQNARTRKGFAGLKYGALGSLEYGRNTGAAYAGAAPTDELIYWGGDSWSGTDRFMTGRGTGLLTYRNSDLFGMVDGLSFALQYQGKNESGRLTRQNGDGVSASISYDLPMGFGVVTSYGSSNRTLEQKADNKGNKAEVAAIAAKYDANNWYAAIMYAQTYNLVALEHTSTTVDASGKTTEVTTRPFANKTQGFEAILQYQFDFGFRPSIGYVQSKGEDLEAVTANGATFKGGKADVLKYIEVGAWYYFNKNMNVYAAYKFNLLNDNDYTKSTGTSTDDEAAIGITYQF